MFRVEMFAAGRGDCIWVEYGDPLSPSRVLIDGGVKATARLLRSRVEALSPDRRHVELLVVTHMDLDHIAGVLALLEDPPAGFSVGDVWFNGWRHLPEDPGLLGVNQAEALTQLLEQGTVTRWNESFEGKAVMIPDTGDLPQIMLPGGMSITLLAPTRHRLGRLRTVWQKAVEAEKDREGPGHPEEDGDRGWLLGGSSLEIEELAAEPFRRDSSIANGSSIALIAGFEGQRCLFAADAFADDVRHALGRLAHKDGESRVPLDAFKLAHHGGKKNTSNDLLAAIACRNFLFSSDGSVYGHPDRESVARVIVHGRAAGMPRLFFNYRSEKNLVWSQRRILNGRCETIYPEEGSAGLVLYL
jgi:beta-lactamase superfamily II metal-dependent hydrolase